MKSLSVHTLLCAWLYQIIAVIWSASFEGPEIQRHGLLEDMTKKKKKKRKQLSKIPATKISAAIVYSKCLQV